MRGADITSMEVQLFQAGQWLSVGEYPPHIPTHTQQDLEPGKAYLFRVVALSLVGSSLESAACTVLSRTAAMPAKAYPPSCVEAKLGLDEVHNPVCL